MAKLDKSELARKALHYATSTTNSSCKFILNTEHHPYEGGECSIFAMQVDGGGRIGIRLEHSPTPNTKYKVETEIRHLKAIRNAKLPHLPELIGFSMSPAFIITKWADGTALKWTESSPKDEIRSGIIKTIAEVTLDLLKIQGKGCSALDWITQMICKNRLYRAKAGSLNGVSVDDCQKLLDRIDRFHIPELDEEPHVLVHGDLQPSNIIVNADMQVECIVDWGFSAIVPFQFSVTYPRFLVNEPRRTGMTFDWPQDAETIQSDRLFYLQCIKEKALSMGGLANHYYKILSRDDATERHWWVSAVSRLDIMKALKYKPCETGLPL